jgi:hypothetical protein
VGAGTAGRRRPGKNSRAGVGVKRIKLQVFERRQESKSFGLYAMNERSAPPADRAVARADVVQLGFDLEPNTAAVTRASIGLFHQIANWPWTCDTTGATSA